MSHALGDPVLSDVKSWIAAAVAEIEAFVSAELRRQLDALVIQNMQAELQAVNTSLYQYASLLPKNQRINRYLLEVSDTATAKLIPLSLNFDQALYITTAAMGFRLFVVLGLYNLDHDEGHIKSARDGMNEFVTKTVAIRKRIASAMDPTGRVTTRCNVFNGPKVCEALVDGNVEQTAPLTASDVQAQRQKLADIVTARYLERRDAFITTANQSIAKATVCYDKICKLIGTSYDPPADVDFTFSSKELNPVANILRSPLHMPGATVRP